jgi:hypothetical protein
MAWMPTTNENLHLASTTPNQFNRGEHEPEQVRFSPAEIPLLLH